MADTPGSASFSTLHGPRNSIDFKTDEETSPNSPNFSISPPGGNIYLDLTEEDEVELAKTAGSPAFFAPELCSIGEVYEF